MPAAVDARRTKRVRDESDDLTLEERIAARRLLLVTSRKQAPELRHEATRKRAMALELNRRWQRRMRLGMLEEADRLDREAEVRESMVREHEYETTVVSYLRMYHKRADVAVATSATRKSDTIEAYVRHTDITGQRRSSILDEYLVEMNQAAPKVAMAARDECPSCAVQLLLCTQKSIMTCPKCGYTVTYLDATSSSTSFEDVVEYSQYSYKRANHFSMWVLLCQGKESHRVPDATLRDVMVELQKQRVCDVKDITQKRVREILRRLKLKKAYDHVAQITARISGIPPLRISTDTEERLRIMFLQMQPAFERHAPKTRTNFLSYSYVLYRCFQIMGLNHMLEGIPLLKGKDKLEANDAIFRKMCQDLGWPVYDLP